MKRSTLMAILLLLIAVNGTGVIQAQTSASMSGRAEPRLLDIDEHEGSVAALLQQLTVELKRLRLDLLKRQHERQLSNIKQLLAEQKQVEITRQALLEEEHAFNQQIAPPDPRSVDPTLVPEQRTEAEAAKADLAGNGVSRFQSEQERIVERDAEVIAKLEQAQRRRQHLVERAREIKAQSNEIQTGNAPQNVPLLLKQLAVEFEKMKFDLETE